MKRRDPVSTPARRRRIIAEFAKKTLRIYCIDACKGVVIFRSHTKASLSIQCWIRFYMARRRVAKLRFERRKRAAIIIQCVIRMKLAMLRRRKLFAERLLKRQLRLNECVHQLIYIRRQKLARVAMIIALRIAREKKEKQAAINIQRVFRGFQARKTYLLMYEKHQAYLKSRHDAAVKIQAQIRRILGFKRYKYYSTRRTSLNLIKKQVLKWWSYRTYKRKRAAMVLQRMLRGLIGKKVVQKMRVLKEEERQRVAQLLCTQIQLELVDELIAKVAMPLVPVEKTMTIHVDIDISLLEHMENSGARAVVSWCLANSILEFRNSMGYRAGAVVQQVVKSVETALLRQTDPLADYKEHSAGAAVRGDLATSASASNSHQPTLSSEIPDSSMHDRVIALDKWDEGDETDIPSDRCLPSRWGILAYEHHTHDESTALTTTPSSENSSHSLPRSDTNNNKRIVGVGAAVSVDCVSNMRIELHITTVSEVSFHHPFNRNVVIISFDKSENTVSSSNVNANTNNSGNVSNHNETLNDDNTTGDVAKNVVRVQDLKFRFKNALVFVNNPQPSPPKPPALVEEVEEEVVVVDDDDDNDDDNDDNDEEEDEEIVRSPEPAVRPSTAVVRIVLREPTPPPAPVDFDGYATTLQMLLRRRYQWRVRFIKRIQRAFRRCRRVFVWQELVYSMLEVGHDAATIIQCWLRRAAAQRLLVRLKELHYRAHYGHNFLLDERDNWEAFGLPPCGTHSNSISMVCDCAYRSPLVGVTLTAAALGGLVGEVHDMAQFVQAFAPPPAGEVLNLLDYTPPPPGCVYLTGGVLQQSYSSSYNSNYSSAVRETADGDQSAQLLLAIDIPEEVYGYHTALTDAVGSTAAPAHSAAGACAGGSGRDPQYFVRDPVLRTLGHLPGFSYEGSLRMRAVQAAICNNNNNDNNVTRHVAGRPSSPQHVSQLTSEHHITQATILDGNSHLSMPSDYEVLKYRQGHLGDLAAQDIEVFAGDLTEWLSVRGSAGMPMLVGKELHTAKISSLENAAPMYQVLAANLY